jgi:hypothetical protein
VALESNVSPEVLPVKSKKKAFTAGGVLRKSPLAAEAERLRATRSDRIIRPIMVVFGFMVGGGGEFQFENTRGSRKFSCGCRE